MLHFVDALELCEFLPLCPREDKLVALYPCSKNASVWWGTVGIQHTAHSTRFLLAFGPGTRWIHLSLICVSTFEWVNAFGSASLRFSERKSKG